eukprot:snap_masked-scaffold_32-processed-gene-0.6-mRNA-1 protein AED:1.00 eAED:1.00 QI:0/-1/0/0/-1/1/1/0/288
MNFGTALRRARQVVGKGGNMKEVARLIQHNHQQNTSYKLLGQIQLLNNNVPLPYIINLAPFFKHDFHVTEHVLIPRSDSEAIVEYSISQINNFLKRKKDLKINVLEFGVGSGCLLLSIVKELEEKGFQVHGTGVDISKKALQVAEKNINLFDLDKKVDLLQMDFNNMKSVSAKFSHMKQFDLIVSNPPYVTKSELESLKNTSKQFQMEPELALSGNRQDVIDNYRSIINLVKINNLLTPSGKLILEFGDTQKPQIEKIILTAGLVIEEIIKDLNQKDRGIVAKYEYSS